MTEKLFLEFQLGDDRYALDCAQIIEVLPLLRIKPLLKAPRGIAGAMNYRGHPIPVIDLSELALGRPASVRMSTRIIIVHYPAGNGTQHPLGLIVEKATESVRRDPADFAGSGVFNRDAPYLGPVATGRTGLVQLIDASRLLPALVRDVLFREAVEPQ